MRQSAVQRTFTYALTKQQGSQVTQDVAPCIVHNKTQSLPLALAR